MYMMSRLRMPPIRSANMPPKGRISEPANTQALLGDGGHDFEKSAVGALQFVFSYNASEFPFRNGHQHLGDDI